MPCTRPREQQAAAAQRRPASRARPRRAVSSIRSDSGSGAPTIGGDPLRSGCPDLIRLTGGALRRSWRRVSSSATLASAAHSRAPSSSRVPSVVPAPQQVRRPGERTVLMVQQPSMFGGATLCGERPSISPLLPGEQRPDDRRGRAGTLRGSPVQRSCASRPSSRRGFRRSPVVPALPRRSDASPSRPRSRRPVRQAQRHRRLSRVPTATVPLACPDFAVPPPTSAPPPA